MGFQSSRVFQFLLRSLLIFTLLALSACGGSASRGGGTAGTGGVEVDGSLRFADSLGGSPLANVDVLSVESDQLVTTDQQGKFMVYDEPRETYTFHFFQEGVIDTFAAIDLSGVDLHDHVTISVDAVYDGSDVDMIITGISSHGPNGADEKGDTDAHSQDTAQDDEDTPAGDDKKKKKKKDNPGDEPDGSSAEEPGEDGGDDGDGASQEYQGSGGPNGLGDTEPPKGPGSGQSEQNQGTGNTDPALDPGKPLSPAPDIDPEKEGDGRQEGGPPPEVEGDDQESGKDESGDDGGPEGGDQKGQDGDRSKG